jgi:hypothetical protein
MVDASVHPHRPTVRTAGRPVFFVRVRLELSGERIWEVSDSAGGQGGPAPPRRRVHAWRLCGLRAVAAAGKRARVTAAASARSHFEPLPLDSESAQSTRELPPKLSLGVLVFDGAQLGTRGADSLLGDLLR